MATLPRASLIPSSELLADYKTYLSSVGILFVIAAFFIWVYQEVLAKYLIKSESNDISYAIQTALFCFTLFVTGFATLTRNKVWSSGEAFWENIIKNAPEKARGYNNYGVALSEQGRFKEAIPYFEKAISMDDKYPDPCNKYSNCVFIYRRA